MRAVRGLLRAQARARQRRLRRADGGGGLPCSPPGAPGRHRGTGPRREPGPDEWRVAYEALQQSARSLLRRSRSAPGGRDDDLLSPAETVIVRRCQDCGGVDAPQPCIDVCIWGPCIWVRPTGWMRPRMSRSARGPPSISRLSSRWLACCAGSRSQRRVTGSGSEAGGPVNRKRGSLSGRRGSRRAANEMAIRQAEPRSLPCAMPPLTGAAPAPVVIKSAEQPRVVAPEHA